MAMASVCSSSKHGFNAKSAQDTAPQETMKICNHPVIFKNICQYCSKDVGDSVSTIQLSYIEKNLSVSTQAKDQILKTVYKSLLEKKKLCLVLDLDHTLLHSVRQSLLSPNEKYLLKEAMQNKPDGNLYTTPRWITKLRPYVREFLKEASKMFEMYVYTMGKRTHAFQMAEILDPGSEYFKRRVISRDDSTVKYEKSLDVVMAPESVVVILDDYEFVWNEHRENLIVMEEYLYFSGGPGQNSSTSQSLAELKEDESETDGALAKILKRLSLIHQMFFDFELDMDDNPRDVRQVLKRLKQ